MIFAVPSVSSVHVELDGMLPSTDVRTDVTTKPHRDSGDDKRNIYVLVIKVVRSVSPEVIPY